jgi:hypothetical protein
MRICSCERIRNGGTCQDCEFDHGLFYGHLTVVLDHVNKLLDEKIIEIKERDKEKQ